MALFFEVLRDDSTLTEASTHESEPRLGSGREWGKFGAELTSLQGKHGE